MASTAPPRGSFGRTHVSALFGARAARTTLVVARRTADWLRRSGSTRRSDQSPRSGRTRTLVFIRHALYHSTKILRRNQSAVRLATTRVVLAALARQKEPTRACDRNCRAEERLRPKFAKRELLQHSSGTMLEQLSFSKLWPQSLLRAAVLVARACRPFLAGESCQELPWWLPGGLPTGYGAVGSTPQHRSEDAQESRTRTLVFIRHALYHSTKIMILVKW